MKLAMYQNKPIVVTENPSQITYQPITNIYNIRDFLSAPRPLTLGDPQILTDLHDLSAPIENPKQIFAVGFNYADHMAELHTQAPKEPNIFTKYQSSITGPYPTVQVQGQQTDWETELVVVVGQGGRNIQPEDAAKHIGGYMVGEDLSDRRLQFANTDPQFGLAKSYANFSPVGPWLTTPDSLPDVNTLQLTTSLNGVAKQNGNLMDLIFDGAALISYLSGIVALYPGDLIFTGTPGGVGVGRKPQEFIKPGDTLVGEIQQLGRLEMNFTD
ncbi:fumarylacetoacetate hydrolase family protein [Agrilactobacillus composti DSM 18527 = JCM 14202]|uniref:Fumarylacetoacetate hydrolase family protein n=1 Tax=Agrilactobacillus composti DSM 18527 = JCM 14202 TaxID=1423734 RepID=X0QN59_9LACO|nr:fumarylacetoacetate hydrolase family protein [Agrilactobacillus composti]KRM36287.1 fumarylacetoacetate hydrolase family protein [Agrilactobacillus composti DSM 18527 = JCM 14202]GAF40035.1 5-oxopent-3-ene-1,2,5-tricarboxylate decarboxylase [Agrilactobacillus composti DSM 18527 = JCM 14202]